MPKIKGSTDLLASLDRAGSLVDLSVADSDSDSDCKDEKLEITQIAGLLESSILELPNGRSAYMMCLSLTNHTSRPIYIFGVELQTSWEQDFFQWLQPLRFRARNGRKRHTSYQIYRLPDPSGLQLTDDEVLNHVLLESRAMPPGRPLEGCLLAIGGQMPPALPHGQLLDVTLTIFGSDHMEYAQSIRLLTKRLETSRQEAIEIEKGTNLLEEPLNSNDRDAVRVPSVETGMHARSHQLQEPHRRAKPVDDRTLRNQEAGLPARPKEFPGLYGPASRQGEARVHKTIADTVKNPTKPDQGRVDETPTSMKKVAVGRKQLDAG